MFGFLHVLLSLFQQLFNATLLGIVLGLLAVRSRSILPGIIFHFLNNAMAVSQGYLVKAAVVTADHPLDLSQSGGRALSCGLDSGAARSSRRVLLFYLWRLKSIVPLTRIRSALNLSSRLARPSSIPHDVGFALAHASLLVASAFSREISR